MRCVMFTMETSKKRSTRGFFKTLGTALLALSFVSSLSQLPAKADNNGLNKMEMAGTVSESLVTPDELIVEINPAVVAYNVLAGMKAKSWTPITYQAWLVKFNSHSDLIAAIPFLRNHDDIYSFGRNFKLTQCSSSINYLNNTINGVGGNGLVDLPTDPHFPSEWHMAAVKCASNQPKETTTSFNGVVILDNGMANKSSNPDTQIMMDNYDVHGGGWNSSFDSTAKHGTMLATTLGAKWNNIATAGIQRTPRTWSVRLTQFGQGQITEADLLQGLMWTRAQVGNTSGYPMATAVPLNVRPPYSLSSIKYHPAFHAICKNMYQNFSGLTYVAAGNDGMYDNNPRVPYLNIVGACDKEGKILPSSNRGQCLTLLAPGKDIVCTDHAGNVVSG
ncbi:MAG TPA: hypothetical protein EYN91_16455, partial [Candidatus Melainabacteria bacterium]|nr:hypothetical protein [Candidatus Melainabacteria bacterium]